MDLIGVGVEFGEVGRSRHVSQRSSMRSALELVRLGVQVRGAARGRLRLPWTWWMLVLGSMESVEFGGRFGRSQCGSKVLLGPSSPTTAPCRWG